MVMVGVPIETTLLETDELDDPLARLTPANAAPAAAAAMAPRMIHFLWLPDPILVVVGVISPDFAVLCAVSVGVISPDFGVAGAGASGPGWAEWRPRLRGPAPSPL